MRGGGCCGRLGPHGMGMPTASRQPGGCDGGCSVGGCSGGGCWGGGCSGGGSEVGGGVGVGSSAGDSVPSLMRLSPRPLPPRCRSEEHTSELQSHSDLVCRLLLEKKKKIGRRHIQTNNKKKKKKR